MSSGNDSSHQQDAMIFFYVTAPNQQEALHIASDLVEGKLVACANIIRGVTSIYEYEGKLEQAEECIIILKTISRLRESVASRLKAIHTYTTPCIVSFDAVGINEEFYNWINSSVQ